MQTLENNFYRDLKPFENFSSVVEDGHYAPVPDDWYLVLTDIRGSTKAIEKGMYKQVNMIGAASITCVINVLGGIQIPYVFGGDGATMLVPAKSLRAVTDQLQALQKLSLEDFKIELRVGVVPVQKLYQENYSLKVAKYQLSPGNYLAQFRGGGLARAEEMVKKNIEGASILNAASNMVPSLQGLSCRLDPFKSQQGQILSLICKSRDLADSDFIISLILDELNQILHKDLAASNPVSLGGMRWKWISPSLRDESALQKAESHFLVSWFRTFLRSLIVNMSLKLNIRLGPFLPEKYKSEIVLNSDFKKFDEMLRMVIDCSEDQTKAIENLLAEYLRMNKIFYGLHKSSEALMTCMVFSASENQHVHFIDGGQGGYTLAALEMKKQIAAQ